MKIFAAILSIYIMVLTAMPCADIHAANMDSNSIELSVQSTNHDGHSDHFDSCSPFCSCNCCQTLSFTSEFNFSIVNIEFVERQTLFNTSIQTSYNHGVWEPPQK